MKTQALRLTRLAAAAAFAAAFSVQAADFSVYGIVDTGIIVEHNKMGSQPSSTSAREEFGVNLGPRIGLTGTEDLGNGTKVKMLLENLFESDDGEMLFSRLWGGEASLALEGSMGEIAFGRMGALVSPFGHWGIFGMQATPFGFGWGRSGGMHWMVGGDRLDNTISYATPTIAGGLQLFAQYSFQTGTNADPGVEESKERHNTRRASAAFRWQGQSLTAVGVLDRIKLISAGNLAPDNQSGIAGRGFDGWVASLNAQIKCFGGDLYLTSAYDDWEYKGHVVDGQTTDLKRVLFGAAFEYPLSKHTHLYASANWTHGSGLFDTKNFSDSSDPNSSQVMAGLTYFF